MLEEKTYTATIDRIEEGIAVILVEDDGEVIEERRIRDLDRIPDDGLHAGAVVRITVEDGEISTIEYDGKAEQTRRKRIQKRFDKLSERPPGRDSET